MVTKKAPKKKAAAKEPPRHPDAEVIAKAMLNRVGGLVLFSQSELDEARGTVLTVQQISANEIKVAVE